MSEEKYHAEHSGGVWDVCQNRPHVRLAVVLTKTYEEGEELARKIVRGLEFEDAFDEAIKTILEREKTEGTCAACGKKTAALMEEPDGTRVCVRCWIVRKPEGEP